MATRHDNQTQVTDVVEEIGGDTLLASSSHIARLVLGCVSWLLYDRLRLINEEWRTRAQLEVQWYGPRGHVVYLSMNAPAVVRIVWRTSKRIKEVRLLVSSYMNSSKKANGTYNYELHRMDVLTLEYTLAGKPRGEVYRYGGGASLQMCHDKCTVKILSPSIIRGRRFERVPLNLEIPFDTPRRAFDQMLLAVRGNRSVLAECHWPHQCRGAL